MAGEGAGMSQVGEGSGPEPTEEQMSAVMAFARGEHLVLQAGAGTGKTTTLALLAACTDGPGTYIAFNKAIAADAASRFPGNVQCRTAHSLAYGAVGYRYRARLGGPRVTAWKVGEQLGVPAKTKIGPRDVSARALSYCVVKTVTRFCQSADPQIEARHVPPLRGIEAADLHAQLTGIVVPYARKAWADLQNPDEGIVRFEHDHYLKMWALEDPVIRGEFLLLDEAQDTNPVLEQVFTGHRDRAQLVMVGDSAQAIYGWRGARDVMTGFEGTQLALSQSFRFGPPLAAEANRWLNIVEAPIRLTGAASINTQITAVSDPDAVLCRTNVGAMVEIMALQAAGLRVGLVGGGQGLAALAYAARDLKAGKPTTHPELILFPTWGELQDYAEEDPSGRDLQPLVELIDEHGAEVILTAVNRLVNEDAAQVMVSTAHKAKGREWASVRIGADFPAPEDEKDAGGHLVPGPVDDDEARLAYVAITRARHRLDIGGLAWINDHPAGNPDLYNVKTGGCCAHPGHSPSSSSLSITRHY